MKEFYIVSGVAAKGGDWGAMTPRNWGRIGGHLRWSYATLGNFANDIYDFLEKEGRFPGNLEMRADHYRGRAKAIFHKTLAIVQEWPDLPAYPGDGSTQCLSNCLCNWVVERTPDAWHCYWTLGLAEHCQDCVARSQIWNPLVIPFEPPEEEFPPGTPIPPDKEEAFLRFLRSRTESFFAKEGRTVNCQRLKRFLDPKAWERRRKGAAAVHSWDSDIELSPDTWHDLRVAWSQGEVRDWFDAVALRTLLHEFLHTINPIKPSDYSVPIYKAFEEATTEEAAHKLWRSFAEFLGLSIDPKLIRVGAFYKKWRDEFKLLIWRASRYRLRPDEVMLTLKYSVPPNERVSYVAKLFEKNYPEASTEEVGALWLAIKDFKGTDYIERFRKRKGLIL